ncbi:MAG: L-2-amino-thiazoline-4-carboxylic acid hydrolase [Blautia faecis]
MHFDIARCLYRNMCEKYCCPELCTVFCQSDITAFSGYEPKIRFERAGTLGEGADCCDFHFIHGSH